jgi:hypothetical protein
MVAGATRFGSRAVTALAGRIVVNSIRTASTVVTAVRVTNGMRNKIRSLMTRREFARRLANIYKRENHQSQKEKPLEEMWGIVKDLLTVDVCLDEYRISDIPNDHFYQELMNVFKGKKKHGFTL